MSTARSSIRRESPAGSVRASGRVHRREKQLEYTFRRALMRRYADFDVCTLQALRYVGTALGVALDEAEEHALLDAYHHLPAFADVPDGLARLKRMGHRLVALTNGTLRSARGVLENAGISDCLEAVLSVEPLATFKPDPAVYALLEKLTAGRAEPAWLVSANPFDVIGAKAAGLRAAWLRRDPQRIFDPWEFSPDVVVANLEELCEKLPPGR